MYLDLSTWCLVDTSLEEPVHVPSLIKGLRWFIIHVAPLNIPKISLDYLHPVSTAIVFLSRPQWNLGMWPLERVSPPHNLPEFLEQIAKTSARTLTRTQKYLQESSAPVPEARDTKLHSTVASDYIVNLSVKWATDHWSGGVKRLFQKDARAERARLLVWL
ncbi:hypothetical protein P691DRAFT_787347 [Macrolepiota fuliginosa MF-IS2]|uniref:Uncharacterized protein n=1 Tax=Macrolepiota fuliginosa MF-IS2 TaxID=1400762 RepID=A0A9P5XI66_9AGAR|nr:hypothetical protein P691DRAFT_787347 [Macrolepiota fuliginosa MF-IS2]